MIMVAGFPLSFDFISIFAIVIRVYTAEILLHFTRVYKMRIESAIFEMVSPIVSRENLSMWKEHLKILSRYYDNTIPSSQNFLQSSFSNCIIYFASWTSSLYSKLHRKVNWKIWHHVIPQDEKRNMYVILFRERNIISFIFLFYCKMILLTILFHGCRFLI